jgi:thiosulfate dehydrogenase
MRIRLTPALLAVAGVAGAGCTTPEPPAIPEWQPPAEAEIPNDSLGAAIRRGLAFFRFTPESLPGYATSSLRCTSCHQQDGRKASAAPVTGAHARYPRYLPRSGAVVTLADRVNFCLTRSLAGYPLPHGSREMEDFLAYLAFLSRGLPVGGNAPGGEALLPMPDTLAADTARGRVVFEATCAVCHGPDGAGVGLFPALWGPRSYAIGASMARLERAASFIFHNMPQAAPGTLTMQQAYDVAAYINAQPRPDSPGKADDWPAGGAPPDVPYATSGRDPVNPPARLLPRRDPGRTIVPAPGNARSIP